ncbi:MAG: Ig-like domain-containing protein, partial [Heliobacteriaceae bacterium]|nr:Ig-like domain-containing protein [Heliobacteriaceae bacterium]
VDVGTATVIVSTVDGEFQAECVVTVNEEIIEEPDEEQNDGSIQQVTGLRLNQDDLELKVGRTGTLVAMITPASASPLKRELVWATSDPAVVVVNQVGVACKVTAVGVGTATVTVTSPDGNVNEICPVEVTDTAGEILPPEEEGVSEDPVEPVDDPGTKEFPGQTGVDPQKIWTIRFNGPVHVSGISTEREITVRNACGKRVAVTLQPGDDGNSLQVIPPEDGYLPGTYTLRVKNLKNASGKLLQHPVKIRFAVAEPATVETIN